MREQVISVTHAARNFADCINRAHYQGTSFLLEKNGVPVARIIPAKPYADEDVEQLATALRAAHNGVTSQQMTPPVAQQSAQPAPREEPQEPAQVITTDRRQAINW
jgi:prevent-host-death family protein